MGEQTRTPDDARQTPRATARNRADDSVPPTRPAPAQLDKHVPASVPSPVQVRRRLPGQARPRIAAISAPAMQRLMRATAVQAIVSRRPEFPRLHAATHARPVARTGQALEPGQTGHRAAQVPGQAHHMPADRILRRPPTDGTPDGNGPATPAAALTASERMRAQTTPAQSSAPAAQPATPHPPAPLDPAAVRRAFEQIPAPDLSRIADRLMSQIERRGRIERERHGWD